ncbi:uncharacterized protein PB18E9.04c-like [Rhagoletis pomonella]|uniref:uncharacterized protein PB18E9.04c-like n=1 Tax=Rhagoletis pomonella TaxID=28610 RepID=UPI00177B209D|nr:uncharacterized protein PB18E9.04c-like [Rhagoletis pomonella]
MCYVCEDCSKVTKETPLEACDATYFEKLSTTEEPTADPTTTTTTTSTETSTESSTTTEPSTTTSVETTTAGSTTEAIPAPSTVGPAPTTTTVPTPPIVGSAVAEPEEVDADNATTITTTENALNATTITENALNATTTTGAPQALPYVADDYSYHCFSVQKMVNGTASLDRGCSRVTTMESVCGQLRALNNGTQLSKCIPCSNSNCNGSSALGVSVAAFMFTLVAALLSRQ